jgi:hypothetical protein
MKRWTKDYPNQFTGTQFGVIALTLIVAAAWLWYRGIF